MLLPCGNNGAITDNNGTTYPLRALLLITEVIICIQAVFPGVFNIVYVLIAGICSAYKYIKAFSYDPLDKGGKGLMEYKKMQIVVEIVNDCCRHSFFPVCVLGPPLMQILGCFATIKLHNEIDWPLFALFPLFAILGLMATMLPLLGASKIFVASGKVMSNFRSSQTLLSKKGVKSLKMVLRSTKPLRIWFGGNFVDSSTPIVIQDFCMRQTASLLLFAGANNN